MKYDRQFTIVVPKYSNAGERIDTSFAKKFSLRMAEEFGGVTVHPTVLGCWEARRDGKPVLECEENLLITSAVDSSNMSKDELERKRKFVERLAKEIGNELGQESVMVVEDLIDRVEFVEGHYRKSLPAKTERDFFKKLLD
ncbi:hypothetical protein DRP07_00180 [Archaeoglobales archaeon]|nr:MAG: hypothetical protein DRP07_00180 [Archaeoglobales archaeon]